MRLRGSTLAASMIVVAATLAITAAHASAGVVWLCRPGQMPDGCAPGLSTTVYSPSLTRVLAVEHPQPVASPAIDCFYVYPTVSDQPTGNATLQIDPEERSIALYQAARYSQYCRVFAPMYRQVTLAGIGTGARPTTKPNSTLAFDSVQGAFRAYLRTYNHNRGFVLIGHSQGSFILRELIARDIDRVPALRARLVSAILFGGNVTVRRGTGIDGDFRHIPACRSASQIGCVIAFSTFDEPPPPDTLFGVPDTSSLKPLHNPHLQVLCTNPAALGGGSGLLDPIAPSVAFAPYTLIGLGLSGLHFTQPTPPTVWWSAPGAYSARCETLDHATVLEIKPRLGAPLPTASPDAAWGLHLLDANIALGNLLKVVQSEAAAFTARRGL